MKTAFFLLFLVAAAAAATDTYDDSDRDDMTAAVSLRDILNKTAEEFEDRSAEEEDEEDETGLRSEVEREGDRDMDDEEEDRDDGEEDRKKKAQLKKRSRVVARRCRTYFFLRRHRWHPRYFVVNPRCCAKTCVEWRRGRKVVKRRCATRCRWYRLPVYYR